MEPLTLTILFVISVLVFIRWHSAPGGPKDKVLAEIIEKKEAGDIAGAESTFWSNTIILVVVGIVFVVVGGGIVASLPEDSGKIFLTDGNVVVVPPGMQNSSYTVVEPIPTEITLEVKP